MAQPPRADVTQEELDVLFNALDIWPKIEDGRLSVDPVLRARVPSHGYPGGTSDILRHRNAAGYQVATSHRITDSSGNVVHWHGKDLHLGQIVVRPA